MLRLILWPLGVVRRRPIASLAVLLLLVGLIVPVAAHCRALYEFRQAEQALDEDRLDDAHSYLSFCLTVWPWSAPTHFLAARVARIGTDYPEADAQLTECRRLQGGPTADVQLERLLLRGQNGEMDDVIEGLAYASENDKVHEKEILESLAQGHMALLRYLPALEFLDRCLKDYPDDVRALDWRGWVLEQLQQQEKAVADYQRALELAPKRLGVRLRLALLYLDHNEPELAKPHLQRLDKDEPGRPEVQLALAEWRFLSGDLDAARALLDKVLAARPDDAAALLYLGKLELQSGRPEEAETYFRRVLKQDPNNRDAQIGLYDSLRGRAGREAEADDALKEYNRLLANARRMQELLSGEVERASDNPEPGYELGKLYLELGRDDIALYWLNAALKRDRNHKPTHALLADYFDKKGDKERAAVQRSLAK